MLLRQDPSTLGGTQVKVTDENITSSDVSDVSVSETTSVEKVWMGEEQGKRKQSRGKCS